MTIAFLAQLFWILEKYVERTDRPRSIAHILLLEPKKTQIHLSLHSSMFCDSSFSYLQQGGSERPKPKGSAAPEPFKCHALKVSDGYEGRFSLSRGRLKQIRKQIFKYTCIMWYNQYTSNIHIDIDIDIYIFFCCFCMHLSLYIYIYIHTNIHTK